VLENEDAPPPPRCSRDTYPESPRCSRDTYPESAGTPSAETTSDVEVSGKVLRCEAGPPNHLDDKIDSDQ